MDYLRFIKIAPVGFESLGVRSMCTYVETPDIKVLLDAGASLCPNRYGLPPHPKEYKALKECRRQMLNLAERAEVITVSHYHFDHHTPSFTDWVNHWSSAETAEKIYMKKIVFAKNYKSNINASQRQRGWMFYKTSGKKAQKFEFADSRVFKFKDTTIKFSDPVFHGEKFSGLGWVLMTVIQYEREKIVFAPDVQGPMYNETAAFIIKEKPELVIVGGPPIYLAQYKANPKNIKLAIRNLESIAENVQTIILDHHILRDEHWIKIVQPAIDKASIFGHQILTAAEYAGLENNLIEAHRKNLYEVEPPSTQFMKWTKMPLKERKYFEPPI